MRELGAIVKGYTIALEDVNGPKPKLEGELVYILA